MKTRSKVTFIIIGIALLPFMLSAQNITKEFTMTTFTAEQLSTLKMKYGEHKIIPKHMNLKF